jgi:polar amino acid transport system substrate-binding protein/glutamate/aspartate transport system substrate-binding protein
MRQIVRRALVAVLLAACAVPAAAEGVLDRLKETGRINLGVREDAPPLSYTGEDGKPAGYSVLVCNAVAAALGKAVGHDPLEIGYVTVGTEDRFSAVRDGKVDILCGADTITLSRREEVDFSIPIFVDGAAVLIRKGSAANLDALAGKKIGVRAGTTTEEVLRATLAAKKMQADVVTFDSHPDGLKALEDGEIEAYFGDQSILYNLLFKSDKAKELSISDNTLTVEVQGLALPRGDDDFRLAVDRAVSGLYRDGQMEAFFKQALPGAEPGLALKALFLIAPQMD